MDVAVEELFNCMRGVDQCFKYWRIQNVTRCIKRRGVKMNIFIGSLSYNVTEEDLRNAFRAFGEVASATVIKDEQSGRSKGFGFVEMPVQAEAQSAIAALNGRAFKGRTITVNEARSQSDDRRGRDRGGRGDRRGRGRY